MDAKSIDNKMKLLQLQNKKILSYEQCFKLEDNFESTTL